MKRHRGRRQEKKLHTRNKGDEEETAQRIWMNPDALSIECGICFMPFEAEVFMVSTNNKLLSIPTAILCRLMIPLFFFSIISLLLLMLRLIPLFFSAITDMPHARNAVLV
jgi:hypothetical protein